MADEPVNPAPADPAAPPANPDPAPAPSGEPLPPSLTADPVDPSKPATDPAKPDGEKPADAKPAEPVIPEKYELKAADGKEFDQAFVDALTPVFKDLKLTQEQVTKLAETYNKYGTEAEKKADTDFQNWMAEQARENDKAIRKEWGTDYDANFKVAQRGLARFFQDKELYRVLDETGLVRQPAFMKGLLQIGKLIQEDKPPNGAHQGGRKSDAEIFYGSASH